MLKRKLSERAASGRPRRPTPESNNRQQPGPSNSPGQGPINTFEDTKAFLREVGKYFQDVDRGKYKAFANLYVAQKQGRVGTPCMISQVKELFGDHTGVLKLFNENLTPDLRILFKEDVPEIQDLANLYIAKVKARSSPSEYKTFMHLLYLFNERALTNDEIDREVEVLFAKSCDQLQEYYDCFRLDRPAPAVQSPLHPRHSALEVSELQREQQSERLRRMCEKVAKCKRKEKGKGIFIEREQQQSPPPPLLKRVSARLPNAANASGNRRSSRPSVQARSAIASATPAKETQNRSRSQIRSLDLENAEYKGRSMCTPSYMMLKPPKNGDGDGGEVSVHRSELAKSVLNEECELVVRGRNFERGPCNPHAEVLFTCEMEQYECDMIIKRLVETSESFMNYLLKLQKSNIGELPPVKELLIAMHKRCIQQLYDDDTSDDTQTFIEALEENPARALPVILNRLVLKLEELRSFKAMITPIWSQMYKKNLHLSLEYQSIDRKSKVKFKNTNNLEASTNGSTNPT